MRARLAAEPRLGVDLVGLDLLEEAALARRPLALPLVFFSSSSSLTSISSSSSSSSSSLATLRFWICWNFFGCDLEGCVFQYSSSAPASSSLQAPRCWMTQASPST